MQKFLRNEKVKDERVRHAGEQGSVQFVGASFSYSDDADPVLKDINLTIAPGEFVAIVGKVGSGKSSMVNALLGEMKTKSGSLAVNGSLAYTAALESWIQNATVKDNIVFGKTFDLNAYQNAIQASALHSDLELLPGGDQTEIGERGINLSGGQKARVSLARAVYQDCDVYLLDDPLSSVDAHVGSYIFHSCFLTALKGKTRVLVTHNTNFLNLVDRVIVMEAGSIAEIADYSHLRSDVVALEEAAPAALVKRDSSELIEVEDRRSGKVTLSVYFNYVQYSGGIGVYAICIVALVAWLGTRFLGDLSIKQWTQHSEEGDGYFHLYLMFGSIACVALLLRAVVLIVAGLKAATRIHLDMLERLVRAPINLFFDVTPLGRILNRLAKDQQIIEMDISSTLGTVMTAVGSGVGTMAVCVYFLPWVALVMPALVAFALYLQQVFLQLARETTRLEHVSRSPMVQQFTESVAGLKTMRCFGKQKEFTEKLKKLVETFGRATFTNSGIGTWLLVWMEIFSMCFVGIVVSYLIVAREEPAIAALVVTYMIPLGEAVNEFVCEFANLERAMISFERAHALTQ